jgi:hypothetical protein
MGKKELLETRRTENGMKFANEIQLSGRKTNILDIIYHPSMKNMRGKLFPAK